MNSICSYNKKCTACGACENICPKNCVKREKEDVGFKIYKGTECINCGLCEKVCPMNNMPLLNVPVIGYAAWSKHSEIRESSASGGIATELYSWAIDNQFAIVGAELDKEYNCKLVVEESKKGINRFQNSKYTYSYSGRIYNEVEEKVKNQKSVLFIGLPCQVAAMKNYAHEKNIPTDMLIYVSLVCHGTPNPDYLSQHIKSIENKTHKKTEKCCFRDPQYGTGNFNYTLHDGDRVFYRKKVESDDVYQIGFHNALIYRDSCYTCEFARKERCCDITIADFHVRNPEDYKFDLKNVSTVLAHTENGKKVIQEMVDKGYIEAVENSISEIVAGEPQLRHPSVAPKARTVFVNEYTKSGNFDVAASKAFRKYIIKNKFKVDSTVLKMKLIIKKIVPTNIYARLKKLKG